MCHKQNTFSVLNFHETTRGTTSAVYIALSMQQLWGSTKKFKKIIFVTIYAIGLNVEKDVWRGKHHVYILLKN
jgi:hypothetical protein